MTVAIPPVRTTAPDPPLQQLLMRFTGALNRRRAYAATHPMVVAAEDQLHESLCGLLTQRPVLTIGVAKTELLIDGDAAADLPPALSGIRVTPVAYDQLALGDAERTAEHAAGHLWRALAQIAGTNDDADLAGGNGIRESGDDEVELDVDAMLTEMRARMAAPSDPPRGA